MLGNERRCLELLRSLACWGLPCTLIGWCGVVQVACGEDVVSFCNTWVDVRASFLLWGCLCILLSHLLMLQLLHQRGHTLGLLMGLQRFEEKLNGGTGADLLSSGNPYHSLLYLCGVGMLDATGATQCLPCTDIALTAAERVAMQLPGDELQIQADQGWQ